VTTQVETEDLRRALEALWTDMGALARSPLVEQLGLVEGWPERDRQDAYKRASALIEAILDAAQRLKSNGGEEAFALLDRVYGLARQPVELRTVCTPPDDLAARGGLSVAEYERHLDAAVTNLRDAL
jgi:hypothetical protein